MTHFHGGFLWEPPLKSMGQWFQENCHSNFNFFYFINCDNSSIYIFLIFFFFLTAAFFILTVVLKNHRHNVLFCFSLRIGRSHGIGRPNPFWRRFHTELSSQCGTAVTMFLNGPSHLFPHFAQRQSSKPAKRRLFSLFLDFSHFSIIFRNLELFFLLFLSPFIWCQNFWRLVRFWLFIFKNRSSAI